MNRRRLFFGALALGFIVIACYSFSGYAMNASLAGVADDGRYARPAVLWLAIALASLVVGLGLGVVAFKRRPP